jgi:hypothetical protein
MFAVYKILRSEADGVKQLVINRREFFVIRCSNFGRIRPETGGIGYELDTP